MMEKSMDCMAYGPGMEMIESELMTCVLRERAASDFSRYGRSAVLDTLAAERVDEEGFRALLSPAAGACLEEMAACAKRETARHFGNSVTLFTPLYLSNYCENACTYCGFSLDNRIRRGRLSMPDIRRELEAIAQTGLREILLLTGESRSTSGLDYIGDAVEIAASIFPAVGIEIYPLNTHEYRSLHERGADFVSVYQETYDPVCYGTVHPAGGKRSFPYRFHAQERAVRGGMRGVAFGSLLGLGNFRADAFAAGLHAKLLQRKYPGVEISFSFPRLRPYLNNAANGPGDVGEAELLQVMLAYRIYMPFAGITISTRERAGFRDCVAGLAATKLSAGVSVEVGGHIIQDAGDGQFEIADARSVQEVCAALAVHSLQPVFTDHVRV